MRLFSVCAFIALTACNPCKRLSKHPECYSTVTVRDTVRIPSAEADTVFSSHEVRDTIVLQKDRLTVKYFQSNDTVFLSGTCKDSTIIREVKANCPTPIKDGWEWWKVVCATVAGCFILFGILQLRK